jgi:hypothetical protein
VVDEYGATEQSYMIYIATTQDGSKYALIADGKIVSVHATIVEAEAAREKLDRPKWEV